MAPFKNALLRLAGRGYFTPAEQAPKVNFVLLPEGESDATNSEKALRAGAETDVDPVEVQLEEIKQSVDDVIEVVSGLWIADPVSVLAEEAELRSSTYDAVVVDSLGAQISMAASVGPLASSQPPETSVPPESSELPKASEPHVAPSAESLADKSSAESSHIEESATNEPEVVVNVEFDETADPETAPDVSSESQRDPKQGEGGDVVTDQEADIESRLAATDTLIAEASQTLNLEDTPRDVTPRQSPDADLPSSDLPASASDPEVRPVIQREQLPSGGLAEENPSGAAENPSGPEREVSDDSTTEENAAATEPEPSLRVPELGEPVERTIQIDELQSEAQLELFPNSAVNEPPEATDPGLESEKASHQQQSAKDGPLDAGTARPEFNDPAPQPAAELDVSSPTGFPDKPSPAEPAPAEPEPAEPEPAEAESEPAEPSSSESAVPMEEGIELPDGTIILPTVSSSAGASFAEQLGVKPRSSTAKSEPEVKVPDYGIDLVPKEDAASPPPSLDEHFEQEGQASQPLRQTPSEEAVALLLQQVLGTPAPVKSDAQHRPGVAPAFQSEAVPSESFEAPPSADDVTSPADEVTSPHYKPVMETWATLATEGPGALPPQAQGTIPAMPDQDPQPAITQPAVPQPPVEESAVPVQEMEAPVVDPQLKKPDAPALSPTQFEAGIAGRLLETDFGVKTKRLGQTVLQELQEDDDSVVVLLVSSDLNPHRSDLVAGLGMYLCAHRTRPTLIVDADLQEQTISRGFGRQGQGLVEAISGQTTWETCIQPTACDGLQLLPCGIDVGFVSGDEPQQELARIPEFVAQWRRGFGLTIIDGGVVESSLAPVLSGNADKTLICVRLGKSDRDNLVESCQRLVKAGGNIAGCISTGGD